jgi:hypothetical protein
MESSWQVPKSGVSISRRSGTRWLMTLGLAATLAMGVAACGIFGVSTVVTYEVQHYKSQCFGVAVRTCLLTRTGDETAFTNMFEAPSGFEYEWGFTYVIVVNEAELDEVAADGPSIRRTLNNVVSKEPVDPGTSFTMLVLNESDFVTEVSPGLFSLQDEREFLCEAPVDCAGLRAALADGLWVEYDFHHPVSPTDPLKLVEWRVHAATGEPTADGR